MKSNYAVVLMMALYSHLVVSSNECPKVQFMEDFDPYKFLGRWYEMHRDKKLNLYSGECITKKYVMKKNGQIGITCSQNHTQEIDGKNQTKVKKVIAKA